MAELKPCPFCGGSVSIAKTGDYDRMWWFVTRGKGANPCKCRLFMESEDFAIRDEVERKLKLKQDLIEAWNRRAESSGYAPGLTIDRIDSSKGYTPDNCRWATKKQQSNNRKNTIFYTYKGETKALTDWARLYGINRYTLYDRIEKRGWSVEKALETPAGAKMDGGNGDEKMR